MGLHWLLILGRLMTKANYVHYGNAMASGKNVMATDLGDDIIGVELLERTFETWLIEDAFEIACNADAYKNSRGELTLNIYCGFSRSAGYEIRAITPSDVTQNLVCLKDLSNLRTLALLGASDAELVHLKNLRNLEELDISQNMVVYVPGPAVTDEGLRHLEKLVNLRGLELQGQAITDAGMMHLKGLSNLERVDLRDTGVTKAGIAKLKKALPGCEITH